MKVAVRWAMAVFYAVAGALHLAAPEGFLAIMPDWAPFPHLVVAVTGLCEIAGAIGLLTLRYRRWAGVMLALYAICVFPANLKHAFENVAISGVRLSWLYHGPRLALQPILVWWALYASGAIDWPSRGRRGEP